MKQECLNRAYLSDKRAYYEHNDSGEHKQVSQIYPSLLIEIEGMFLHHSVLVVLFGYLQILLQHWTYSIHILGSAIPLD